MKSTTFMLIAGEVSGDTNAAELVLALKDEAAARGIPFPPRFIGAGGPNMRAAGVELAFDLTRHAVIGHWEVLKNVFKFKRLFEQLLKLAIQRQPEVIVLVDFSGFNLRFAAAVRHHVRHRQSSLTSWNPKLVYFVPPQLWASREDRVHQLARDVDLVLSIFPFEQEWYARRAPQLRVEFVGHPMVDRFGKREASRERMAELKCSNGSNESKRAPLTPSLSPRQTRGEGARRAGEGCSDAPILAKSEETPATPLILLLPGSREKEVGKHLPVMLAAAREIQSKQAARFRIILPNHSLEQMVRQELPEGTGIEIRTGDLAVSLAEADLAIAKSGTVTLECAFFGVPAVVVYITNPLLYAIGRHVVKVKHLAMPNLLAGEEVFPELIQNAATPENIARVALDLLNNDSHRATVREKLRTIVASLGNPGAVRRAAAAIWKVAEPHN